MVNSPSTTRAIINKNGNPASPAPPKQPPHSLAILAQPSKHVLQSVHIQSVPGKWQSAQTLQGHYEQEKKNDTLSMDLFTSKNRVTENHQKIINSELLFYNMLQQIIDYKETNN